MRVAVVTGLLAAVVALTWFYLAPSAIGGHTAYIITHGISMEPRFHTGDLAIVRAASTYKIGQIVAYHSSLLHELVLHRIVAIHAGHYTFKGDNNHFLDPVHPTRSMLVGKLWVHLHGVGLVLEKLRTPVGAAILAGAIGLVLISLEKDHVNSRRSRKPARGVSAETRAVKPTDSEGSRAANLRDGLIVSGLAVVVFLALCLYAFERPSRAAGTRAAPYTQKAVFTYSAAVPRNTVYPSGSLSTGDPIFLRFVRRLNVNLRYHLVTTGTANVTGTSSIAMHLSNSTGWSRTVQLTGRRSFAGRQFSSNAVIDLTSVQKLINHVADLTGVPGSDATVVVVASVHLSGNLEGAPADTTFSPMLSFQLTGGQLLPPTTSTTAGGSSHGITDTQPSSVMVSSEHANPIHVFGHSLAVRVVRLVAVGALALSALVALVLLVVLVRLKRLAECEQIEAQYRHLIVPLDNGAQFSGQEPVDLISMEALVKIAHHSGQLILHSQRHGADSYLVHDGDAVYRYRVGGSGSDANGGPPAPPSKAATMTTHSAGPATATTAVVYDDAVDDEVTPEAGEDTDSHDDFTAMEVGAASGTWRQRSEATLPAPAPAEVAVPEDVPSELTKDATPAEEVPADVTAPAEVADTAAGGHDYGLYSVTRASPVTGHRAGNGHGDYPAAAASPSGPLAVATSILRRAITDRPYAATLDATGGSGEYAWAITSGNLPDGLTLDASTGVISGAPTASGTTFFMASVTDSGPEAQTVTERLSIHVNVPPPATRIKHFRVNFRTRAVTFTFKATGEVTGFECALVKMPRKKRAKAPAPIFEACESPKTYKHLALGRYVFYVRAVGPGGPDPNPATHKFRVS